MRKRQVRYGNRSQQPPMLAGHWDQEQNLPIESSRILRATDIESQ